MSTFLLPLLAAAAASAPAPGDLSVFDRLLGHCWEGRISNDALDVHCFGPVYDGVHVRDRHVVLVKGEPAYKGVTYYSREGQRLVFTYLNSDGGVGHGEAVPRESGICFTGKMRATPKAAPQPISTCWRWQADGGYVAASRSGKPVHFVLSRKRL